jgi:hypothetical protein
LSLVVVEIEPPTEAVLRATIALLRAAIRATDGIWRPSPSRLALLFPDAGGPTAEPLFVRLEDRLRAQDGMQARMGRAAVASGIDPATLRDLAEDDLRPIGDHARS